MQSRSTDRGGNRDGNPTNYPDPAVIAKAEEPMVKAEILTPADFVGNVMELCQNRRGVFVNMQYLDVILN